MFRVCIAACLTTISLGAAHAAAPDANPEWVTRPTDEETRAVWPADALSRGVEGKAVLQCTVNTGGAAEGCSVVSETPVGQGFGEAALRLAPTFKLQPARKGGQAVPAAIRVPIWFEAPLQTPPDWLRKPTSDEMEAAWPAEAARKGVGGGAVLVCTVSLRGLLEGCEVDSENPPGMGFGEAALLMTPHFLIKPGMRDGQPVSSTVHIPIAFKSAGSFSGRKIQMVTTPVWEAAPSFADMAAAWPAKATGDYGHVAMRCLVAPGGLLDDCDVLTETPGGKGFGRAARDLAPKFRLKLDAEEAKSLAKAKINVPVHFANPAKGTSRAVAKPRWIASVNPQKVIDVYPPQAIKAGIKSGRGIADCLVGADGSLTCKPGEATPPDLGFAEAAVAVASVMKMNPWSDGGGPVDGAHIKLPVTFNLAPDVVAETPKP